MNDFIKLAKKDPDILGLILTGSRGKGIITKNSDYDYILVIKNGTDNNRKKKYEKIHDKNMDLSIKTFSEFKEYARWNSPESWDRYNFAYLTPYVDKTGQLQKIINEKAKFPRNVLKKFISGRLDHYINQVLRSIKCFRDSNLIGLKLEAAESIPPLLEALFALERRHRPYNKYLEWELIKHPLKNLSWKPKKFIKMILEIISTGNIKTQQKILRETTKLFRKNGFGKVFDAWEGKDEWAQQYTHKTKI